MSYLVWRKDVVIWLTAVILTVICPMSRCSNDSNETSTSSSLKHVSFPDEPPCHILLPGEMLMLRCQFDDDKCETWWCHQDPGTTAYLILPEGDFFGVSVFTRTIGQQSGSRDGSQMVSSESVLLVERTTNFDAGKYLCVCAAKNLSYKIDIAIVNVSAMVQPKCNRRVELTFDGTVEPVNLTVYKWICRPYSARLIVETIIQNARRYEIELDVATDASSTVACYFYLKSPDFSCGVRVIPVSFQIHTRDDMCNIDFLEVSAADSTTYIPDRFRLSFLLLTFLLTFIMSQERIQGSPVIRLIQLHSLDLG